MSRSFPGTGEGHGTATAVILGLAGEAPMMAPVGVLFDTPENADAGMLAALDRGDEALLDDDGLERVRDLGGLLDHLDRIVGPEQARGRRGLVDLDGRSVENLAVLIGEHRHDATGRSR